MALDASRNQDSSSSLDWVRLSDVEEAAGSQSIEPLSPAYSDSTIIAAIQRGVRIDHLPPVDHANLTVDRRPQSVAHEVSPEHLAARRVAKVKDPGVRALCLVAGHIIQSEGGAARFDDVSRKTVNWKYLRQTNDHRILAQQLLCLVRVESSIEQVVAVLHRLSKLAGLHFDVITDAGGDLEKMATLAADDYKMPRDLRRCLLRPYVHSIRVSRPKEGAEGHITIKFLRDRHMR